MSSPALLQTDESLACQESGSYFPPCFTGAQSRHAQLPAFIKPIRSNISKLDREFLIQKGVFWLPPEALRRELIENYFDFVYPFMPLLDKETFLDSCDGRVDPRQQEGGGENRISLLLFQAVMFAGSGVRLLNHSIPLLERKSTNNLLNSLLTCLLFKPSAMKTAPLLERHSTGGPGCFMTLM